MHVAVKFSRANGIRVKGPLIRLSAPSPPQETAGEKALDGVQGADDLSESVRNAGYFPPLKLIFDTARPTKYWRTFVSITPADPSSNDVNREKPAAGSARYEIVAL